MRRIKVFSCSNLRIFNTKYPRTYDKGWVFRFTKTLKDPKIVDLGYLAVSKCITKYHIVCAK